MGDQFARTKLIYGEEAVSRLARARVAVFGLGGVGGYVVEALARSGIGALDLIDHDTIAESNINRQILATYETIGRCKTDVAAERVASIFPECEVRTYPFMFLPETQDRFDFGSYDYVVDAIDTVTGKLAIIMNAKEAGAPVISAMGAGNKTDPSAFMVADIYDTSICPLARIMRRELRKRGIEKLKVVYSREEPVKVKAAADTADNGTDRETRKRDIPGSTAFVPSVAGLILAGEVVRDLIASANSHM